MSHSSETAVAPDRRESPSLAPVRREVERLAGSDEAKVLGPFTDVLLAKAPADLLLERGPEALARTVLDVFRFLERASPDRVNVEVVATNAATAVHALVSDRPFVIDTVRECVAARDILELEAMQAERRRLSVSFSNSADMSWVSGDEPVTELKLYLIRERLVLSDFMPVLENAGLRVIAVNPYEVKGGGLLPTLICVFAVQDREGQQLDVAARGPAVAETIRAVRAGDLSNDILNGLVLATGLHWREVDVLRAYSLYAFQIGAVPARFALPWALLKHPDIASQLWELFEIKFDPERGGSLDERREAAREGKTGVLAARWAESHCWPRTVPSGACSR